MTATLTAVKTAIDDLVTALGTDENGVRDENFLGAANFDEKLKDDSFTDYELCQDALRLIKLVSIFAMLAKTVGEKSVLSTQEIEQRLEAIRANTAAYAQLQDAEGRYGDTVDAQIAREVLAKEAQDA